MESAVTKWITICVRINTRGGRAYRQKTVRKFSVTISHARIQQYKI